MFDVILSNLKVTFWLNHLISSYLTGVYSSCFRFCVWSVKKHIVQSKIPVVKIRMAAIRATTVLSFPQVESWKNRRRWLNRGAGTKHWILLVRSRTHEDKMLDDAIDFEFSCNEEKTDKTRSFWMYIMKMGEKIRKNLALVMLLTVVMTTTSEYQIRWVAVWMLLWLRWEDVDDFHDEFGNLLQQPFYSFSLAFISSDNDLMLIL